MSPKQKLLDAARQLAMMEDLGSLVLPRILDDAHTGFDVAAFEYVIWLGYKLEVD